VSKTSRRESRANRPGRSKGQREVERMNRERLAQAKEDPSMVRFPAACSEPGCHRPALVAVTVKHGHGKFQGWSGCSIHAEKLAAVFEGLKENLALMKSGLQKIEASEAGLVAPREPVIVAP